jgi:hypothetical protein
MACNEPAKIKAGRAHRDGKQTGNSGSTKEHWNPQNRLGQRGSTILGCPDLGKQFHVSVPKFRCNGACAVSSAHSLCSVLCDFILPCLASSFRRNPGSVHNTSTRAFILWAEGMVCLGRIFASILFFHLVFSERANNGEVSHVFSPVKPPGHASGKAGIPPQLWLAN